MKGHHVVARGIMLGRLARVPGYGTSPLRGLARRGADPNNGGAFFRRGVAPEPATMEERLTGPALHYEFVPGLAAEHGFDWYWMLGVTDDVGTEYSDSNGGAFDGRSGTLDTMLGPYLARRGKRLLIDKSLNTAHYADLLLDIYPSARFVCLYRYPMDVIASGMEACPWGLGGYGFDPYIASSPSKINPVTPVAIAAMMASVEEVEVVVAHNERATLRVGDVFVKIDADQARTDVEVEAMAMAPVPTPQILWRKPPALALAALPGTALGHLGEPSTASPAAWAAAGAAARTLHDAPLPPWPGRSPAELASRLDAECEWLVANDVLPAGLVTRNRQLAETALRPWTPVFIHGDLQVDHVFVDGDEVTGIIDWSDAGPGDALFDLAILTLGHPEHLGDVVRGYGTDVDLDVIRGWWAFRCLEAIRWLDEHGFGPVEDMPEIAVLRAQA